MTKRTKTTKERRIFLCRILFEKYKDSTTNQHANSCCNILHSVTAWDVNDTRWNMNDISKVITHKHVPLNKWSNVSITIDWTQCWFRQICWTKYCGIDMLTMSEDGVWWCTTHMRRHGELITDNHIALATFISVSIGVVCNQRSWHQIWQNQN